MVVQDGRGGRGWVVVIVTLRRAVHFIRVLLKDEQVSG